ncbi:glycosyltransferase [Wohlfahrtiimonas chitiniclastica]|uniref:glycosyltransferase n=1 Tax=Wohlfahrtiimonas chitiniclastica TaxID=400946 RepID=UPI001BCC7DBF|nr:glycosyltransferase [Wohlfahrtiimonas chitiniclastica]MBS7834586.1 glycosyltransferase [Wohlfahrtiimonas chitiniclastica]
MTYSNILINTSNLHVGGGVQVATSFLHEFSKINNLSFTPTIYLSTEVYNELIKLNTDMSRWIWEIYNTYGLKNFFHNRTKFSKFDVVFTVFGPNYFSNKKQISITGFAQPWIAYPDNEVYQQMSLLNRLRTRLKFFIQKKFFKRSSKLIVELEHVKEKLIELDIKDKENIYVVKNCISSLYLDKSQWEDINIEIDPKTLNIGFIGRDYPHKNLSILPEVKQILKNKYDINTQFYITLTDEEWLNREDDFTKNIHNVGVLSTTQCPEFYKKMDAIIFPSLLECFSATPLEAMAMKTPLFASDRRFVKDSCSNYAIYFDPLQPSAAAEKIANYLQLPQELQQKKLEEARQHALLFSNAKERALQYVSILE